MQADLWKKVEELYRAALAQPPEKRAAFLQQACPDDPLLRREVQSLLDQQADSFLESAPISALNELAEDAGTRTLNCSSTSPKRFFKDDELVMDRFRIVRFLGRGGMGEVYEADDLQLGRLALKTIRPEMAASRQHLLRFKQEVQLARRITDPHVCRIHDLFTIPASEERPSASFLTMEFLPGMTLAQRIERDGPLPLPEAESIALQLCSALQAVHDSGVIHRDFKSGNVMLVQRNGETHAIVMDLGLAREATPKDDGESGLTMTGAVMGTPQYMAPEQFRGETGPATDIYALGVVLYEMVTGRRPFNAATPLGAAVIRGRKPSRASSIRSGLPPQWDAVISRCLEYEPEARWASAVEVSQALTGRAMAQPHHVFGLSSLHLRLTAGAAILAIVLVSGTLWYRAHSYSRPSPDAERWYLQGVAALREGTYFKAVQALSRAVQFDKDFALAHARLADAWAELDFADKAKDEIVRASSLETRRGMPSIDRTYLDAVRATVTYDNDAAVSDYRSVLEQLPDAEKAYGYDDLGRAEEKAMNLAGALKDYSEAARRAPEDPASYVHLGVVYSRQGKAADGEIAFAKAEALYRASSNIEGTAEIAYQRGYAANLRGDTAHALEYLAQSLRAAQDLPSIQLQVRALTQMSNVETLAGNTDQSISLANKAIRLARDNGLDYWAIDGLIRLGNAYLGNDNAKAEPPLQEALRLALDSGHQRLAANADLSLASIRSMQERNAETIAYAQNALDYYKRTGYFAGSTSALTLLIRSERDQARFGQALSRADEALDIVRKINNPARLIQVEESVGSILLDLEQYPDASNHFQAALAAARSVHQLVEYELLKCADSLWRLGRYTDAESMLDAVPRDVAATPRIKQSIRLIRIRMLLSQGNPEGALREARIELANPKSLAPSTVASLDVVAGTAAARSGSARIAESFCKAAHDNAEQALQPAAVAQAQLCQAEALLTAGAGQRALPLAESAVQFFASSGQQESEWRSLLCLSRIHKATGDWTDAQKDASEALNILAKDEHDWGDSFQTYTRRPDIVAARKELAESKGNRETNQK